MRRLILQVQVSIDGLMARPNGDTDWMAWDWGSRWSWDEPLKRDFAENLDTVDCVLLSSTLAKGGFIEHWELAASTPGDDRQAYASKLHSKHKVVFSSTLDEASWPNSELATGQLAVEVQRLKAEDGRNMIVYGGATFVSALIRAGLVDEFQIYVNPVAIGEGMPVFAGVDDLHLELTSSKAYNSGIVVNTYVPHGQAK